MTAFGCIKIFIVKFNNFTKIDESMVIFSDIFTQRIFKNKLVFIIFPIFTCWKTYVLFCIYEFDLLNRLAL